MQTVDKISATSLLYG